MKRSVDQAKLVELLARGISQTSIARALGYSGRFAIRKALRRRGIRRSWTPCGVPVVEVRR